MCEQHGRVDAAAGDEDDGSERVPPASHRGDGAKQRGHGEGEKHDCGEDDEGQNAFERAESEDRQCHSGLQKNAVDGHA